MRRLKATRHQHQAVDRLPKGKARMAITQSAGGIVCAEAPCAAAILLLNAGCE
jgi:hypothetical protein